MQQRTGSFKFFSKLALLGMVAILFVSVLFCSTSHLFGTDCHKSLLFSNKTLSGSGQFVISGVLLLLLISLILALFLRRAPIFQQPNFYFGLPPSILRITQFFLKIYNPIFQAFRKGILHPQVYNLEVVFS